MRPPNERDAIIERALRSVAHRLDRSEQGGWSLVSVNGSRTTLDARILDDDWLAVAATDEQSAESWWPLLRLNAGFGGCARFARAKGGRVQARGEIFVGDSAAGADDESLEMRVSLLYRDVLSARHEIVCADGTIDRAPAASNPEALLASCRDAGWEATLQACGQVLAPLDTGAAFHQATLTIEDGGHLQAFVPLTSSTLESSDSQEAIALLLLDVSAQLRAVKGVARPGKPEKDFEIAGLALAAEQGPASPAAIDPALAALSVACRTVGREVLALQSIDLARDYLTIRGMRRTDEHASPRHAPEHGSEQEDSPCLQLR